MGNNAFIETLSARNFAHTSTEIALYYEGLCGGVCTVIWLIVNTYPFHGVISVYKWFVWCFTRRGKGVVSVLVFSNVLKLCVYVRENSEKKQKTIFNGGVGWGDLTKTLFFRFKISVVCFYFYGFWARFKSN